MNRRLNISCVIGTMTPGGAERVMAQLCNRLAASGHDVSLLVLSLAPEGSFYELRDNVRLVPLGRAAEGGWLGRTIRTLSWVAGLRKAFTRRRPDVVISFIDLSNVVTLMAAWGLGLPVIASERIDPQAHREHWSGLDRWLCRVTYPRASRIVVQTHRAAGFFDSFPAGKVVAIPNPVSAAAQSARPEVPAPDGRFRIIGVGRLARQKGFDLLIESFAALAGRFPQWDVVIFGQGSDREALLARIAKLGLSGRIALNGVTKDLAGEFARSHLMACPSRYEGFPNALAESMAAGLPAIAFENVSGVEELVLPGKTGILAQPDSESSLTEGLARLMSSGDLRAELGASGRAHVRAFDPDLVLGQWDELIASVVHEHVSERLNSA